MSHAFWLILLCASVQSTCTADDAVAGDDTTLAAPMVGAFNDPNRIVYNEARAKRVNAYLEYREKSDPIHENWGWHAIVNVPAEPASHIYWTMSYSWVPLGGRFREKDINRFLERRASGDLRNNGEARLSLAMDVAAMIEIAGHANLKSSEAVMLKLLNDPEELISSAAYEWIVVVGRDDPAAFVEVAKRFADRDKRVDRIAPFMCLFGPKAVPVVLNRLVANPNYVLIDAIGAFGSGAGAAVPHLMSLLDDRNPELAAHAAAALGEIGPDANAAIPRLIKMKNAGNYQSSWVPRALARMSATSQAALIADAQSKDPETYANAVRALKDARPYASAVAVLLEASASKDVNLRRAAAAGLGNPQAAPVINTLLTLLRDPSPSVRLEAEQAMTELREAGKAGLPALKQALNDPDEDVREWAAIAIQSIEADLDKYYPEAEHAPQ